MVNFNSRIGIHEVVFGVDKMELSSYLMYRQSFMYNSSIIAHDSLYKTNSLVSNRFEHFYCTCP